MPPVPRLWGPGILLRRLVDGDSPGNWTPLTTIASLLAALPQATSRRVIESNWHGVIQLPIFAWARISAILEIARSAVCLSRILLLIVAVESISMPITQGLWSWDKFLHGGQDFELGLLIIVTCLCFVLLRVQQSERCNNLFAGIVALFSKGKGRLFAALVQSTQFFEHRSQIPSPLSSAAFNVPLLI
ncbi:MAG: hypothetical protein JST28_04970 [Acidobacteria bacterium]|nr:hypothetical protein [Acidobacteriota bacterium]